MSVRYATRNSGLEPALTWVLDDGVIRLEDGKGAVREIPLAAVRGVRLDFHPTRMETGRYRCRIDLASGETLAFFNRTYRGLADFQDTSAAYTAFVRQLHAALASHHPGCRFTAGVSAASYALNVAALVFTGMVVVAALLFFALVGLVWVALIKVVLILYYVPTAVRWLKRNRGRAYDPLAIPQELLPCS